MRPSHRPLRAAIAILSVFVWACQGRTFRTNDSELIDEGDYFEGDDQQQERSDSDLQRRQHVLQRSPQQQQQFPPMYNSMLVPNANVQANPLRLPNVLNLPPGAPARWVQPVGNGLPVAANQNPPPSLPANPNLPAGGGRYVLLPVTPGDGKATPPSARVPVQQAIRQVPAPDPTVGRPWDLPPAPAPVGALPGQPLMQNVGQRLIVLPGAKPASDTSKPIKPQQSMQQQPIDRPVFPQTASYTPPPPQATAALPRATFATAPPLIQPQQTAVRIQPTLPPNPAPAPVVESKQPEAEEEAEEEEEGEEAEPVAQVKPTKPADTKISRPTAVHTTHGRLILEPHGENFCDLRQYTDEQLSSRNLQRVEYFVGNLTCSRYFFECAIGQTFLLNCTSKDQVFDINTVNCNFKYNVKSCNEYDHILHCSIHEECQADQFACCAEPQQCIPYSKRCDGIADCNDGEDENNCPSCGVDEFPCVKSGKCISWEKRCNGIPDECFDQTNLDEQNCGGCPENKFTCGRVEPGQTPTCIDVSQRCNGVRDCPKGEDELNCKTKGQKYLLCENQKQSVSKVQWCDGYEDCLDGSDEKYCVY